MCPVLRKKISETSTNFTGIDMENYKKIKTLARGAFGVVYLCERLSDRFKLVIKEIPTDQLSIDDRQVSLNEAKVHSMLNHPNIIAYYESFLEEKHMVIAMEYAEGGTLYDYLRSREGALLSEKEVIKFFCQLLMAMHHVHSQSILHRDLKSHNILLDRSQSFVKIGDFGISKILCTKSKALTVIGTPHYLSPELCQNKPYCQKSDVWALGIILYELLTLRRPFEADNLSALVMKIMSGHYEPVHKNYSTEIKQLLTSMLQREPTKRPSIPQILAQPFIVPSFFELFSEIGSIPSCLRIPSNSILKDDSCVLSSDGLPHKSDKCQKPFKAWFIDSSLPDMKPVSVPANFDSRNLAKIVINKIKQELQMTPWDADCPVMDIFKNIFNKAPSFCQKLNIKDFSDFCTGSGFAVCLSKTRVISTMGKIATGCLGYNAVLDVSEPKIVKSLFGHNMISVDCGFRHVITVSDNNEVFAWGIGEKGCLGLGKKEKSKVKPTIVQIQLKCKISQVFCGFDTSFALTDEKTILACGSNKHNKLGMDTEDGQCVETIESFTLVRSSPLPNLKAIHIAPGKSHTAILTDDGRICTFGSNRFGELGWGDAKLSHNMPGFIDIDVSIAMLTCGDSFTLGLSSDHQCLLWGLGPKNLYHDETVPFVNISDLPCLQNKTVMQVATHEKNIVLITKSKNE